MNEVETIRGIGVALTINATTPAMKRMFKAVRGNNINVISPEHAHVTLVNSYEQELDVCYKIDDDELRHTNYRVGKCLSGLALSEVVFQPDGYELEDFRGKLAVPIKNQGALVDMRDQVARIYREEIGIMLSVRGFIGHLTVGSPKRPTRGTFKNVRSPEIPGDIHVSGYQLHERTRDRNSTRHRKRDFNNRPNGMNH